MPETQWRPRQGSSFQGIVDALIAHRLANPALTQRHKWKTDRSGVAAEVDAFNSEVCRMYGWHQYIEEGDPPEINAEARLSAQTPGRSGRSAALVAGAELIVEWLGEGGRVVSQEQANGRAHICASCKFNVGGTNLLDWFTTRASAAIQKEFERRNEMKLKTPDDDKLGICDVCYCPLKLKVHTPPEIIFKHLPEEQLKALPPECWIKIEKEKSL